MLFITDFISSAIQDIKGGKHSVALALIQFIPEHVDQWKNKMIFCKCQLITGKIPSQFYQANPVIAQEVLDNVKAAVGMFEPSPAPDLEGHITFLEMLNFNNQHNFVSRNESLLLKSVERCEFCSAW